MKNKFLYIILLFLVLGGACVSEFNANIPSSDINILVVEGNIVSDSIVDFYFSKSFSLNEEIPPPGYDDVQVNLVIVGNNGYRSQPANYLGSGVHRISVDKLDQDVLYGVEFEYEGDTYQSTLAKPLQSPEIDSISFSQPQEEGEVSIRISTHSTESENQYFLWTYKEDWEIKSHYPVQVFYDAKSKQYYIDNTFPVLYCWKNDIGKEILVASTESLIEHRIVNKVLYKHEASNDRFSELYSVLIKQQAISKAGYEYYLDKRKTNQDMGGLFTPQPSTIEGNITCISNPDKKVIGFVEVSGNITEKRFYISANHISRPRESCGLFSREYFEELGWGSVEIYDLGYRPVGYTLEMGSIMITAYSSRVCTDCTTRGGTKNKPDYWPNNHQ
ncbi:MAG: DUF4249 domain-containing protein [Bacteroides sp.]|nr:DUF4249 domain-containing protein [Bacteroides sp.]